MGDSESLIDYLWYIIPGAIVTLPLYLLLTNVYEIKFCSLLSSENSFIDGTIILLSCFVIGYFVQTLYRTFIYDPFYLGRRKVLREDFIDQFVKQLKDKANFLKKLKGKLKWSILGFKARCQLDCIYNYLIYSNPGCEHYVKHVRKIHRYWTSTFTCIVAFFFGIIGCIIGVFLGGSRTFTWMCLFYLVFFIVFVIRFFMLNVYYEENEILLIKEEAKRYSKLKK